MDAVEAVRSQLKSVGAQASCFGGLFCELWRWDADVRASSVQGEAVVGSVRLSVWMVDVNNHRDLFLWEKNSAFIDALYLSNTKRNLTNFCAVTGSTPSPLNLLALKMVILSQSVQYMESSKSVILKRSCYIGKTIIHT